jgi:hypothetical protein
MENRERAVIATTTLISSLAFYWFARAKGKPETPYILFGGFIGAIVAELVLIETEKNKK